MLLSVLWLLCLMKKKGVRVPVRWMMEEDAQCVSSKNPLNHLLGGLSGVRNSLCVIMRLHRM